jgi:hypothetical protein
MASICWRNFAGQNTHRPTHPAAHPNFIDSPQPWPAQAARLQAHFQIYFTQDRSPAPARKKAENLRSFVIRIFIFRTFLGKWLLENNIMTTP